MQKIFPSVADYHSTDEAISVEQIDWLMVRVGLLIEGHGDVRFERTNRSGIVMTLDGSARHLTRMDGLDDETPTLPGSICAMPEGLGVHLAWRNHQSVQRSIMVEFDKAMFHAYAPEILSPQFEEGHLVPSNFALRPALGDLVRLLGRELDAGARRGRLFAESVIRLMAFEIAGTVWSRPVPLATLGVRHDRRIALALDYIEAWFTTDVSLTDLCAVAGLSPTQLTHLFRRETGSTPYDYVLRRRLRLAVDLLRRTDLPIATVAVEAGFNDQPHLTRVMQARMGCTPGTLRAR